MIAFDFPAFVCAVWLLITQPPFSIRRIAYAIGLVCASVVLFVLTRVTLLLDLLLFPRLRRTQVVQPLFITGVPRTGTTYLQKLLSLDTEHFAPMCLYHSFVPSITLRKLIRIVARADSAFGGMGARAMRSLEARMSRGLEDIHPWALDEPEEDMFLTAHCFMLTFVYLFVPYVKALTERGHILHHLDMLPAAKRARYLSFYEACVKRHLFDAGGGKRLLSKNTVLTGALESHLERFPDAKVVFLMRRPEECLPSMLSLTHTFWQRFAPEIPQHSPDLAQLLEFGCSGLEHQLRFIESLPPDRLKVIRYEDFLADPRRTVADLYEWMGMEMGSELSERLDRRLQTERRYRSRHAYSLQAFGFDPTKLRQRLAPLYERFGWGLRRVS